MRAALLPDALWIWLNRSCRFLHRRQPRSRGITIALFSSAQADYNRDSGHPELFMALAAGARLGAYEILSALGAGGMGEVYRARDTKLGRDVALKILPDAFTHDPERLARFRREAQVLASLNHPHIGPIYGLDEANGTQFLVLELVDGENLADRIRRGRLPVDEALPIARQIAEALEAAHGKGIIHRDLKPANIALAKGGQVKVLDFGLARPSNRASPPTWQTRPRSPRLP
jgi:eukaryotic-like serine/threonine-protein kinase